MSRDDFVSSFSGAIDVQFPKRLFPIDKPPRQQPLSVSMRQRQLPQHANACGADDPHLPHICLSFVLILSVGDAYARG